MIVFASPDVSAVFDIRTEMGQLLVVGYNSVEYTDDKEHRKAGYLGDGRATILADTVVGSVFIEPWMIALAESAGRAAG